VHCLGLLEVLLQALDQQRQRRAHARHLQRQLHQADVRQARIRVARCVVDVRCIAVQHARREDERAGGVAADCRLAEAAHHVSERREVLQLAHARGKLRREVGT
jgi:hypothetical protein